MTPRVDAIMDALRACRSIAAVDALVRQIGAEVVDMEADPVLYTAAVQIKHLAAYRRWCIRNGYAPPGHAAPEGMAA